MPGTKCKCHVSDVSILKTQHLTKGLCQASSAADNTAFGGMERTHQIKNPNTKQEQREIKDQSLPSVGWKAGAGTATHLFSAKHSSWNSLGCPDQAFIC